MYDDAAVQATVARARQAAAWWGGIGFDERKRRLLTWCSRLARRIDELARVISAETGKPLDDARLECVLVIAHLDWAARNAERVLRRRRVRSGLLMAQEASTLEYQPFGVIAAVYSAHRGEEIAARLRCGMVSVNGVISFAAVPALPFGGVGDSGFGRIHGPDGLREFTRAKSVTRRRFRPAVQVDTFGRAPWAMRLLTLIVRMRYGRIPSGEHARSRGR